MNKRTFLLLACLCLLQTTAVWGQVKLGVKGGYNITDMSVSKDVLSTSNRNGFFVGPTLKWEIAPFGLGMDIAALYDQREADLIGEGETKKLTSKMVTVPLNLRMTFGRGSSVGAFVYAGPQVGFNLNDDVKIIDQAREWKFKESNFSVNIGAGLLLFNTLQLSANYNVAVGKTADVTWTAARDAVADDLKTKEARANAWQLAAAIYF